MERKFHGSESSLYGLFAPWNESAEERKGQLPFQVRVPVFPVLSSVLIGPTSALTDGCSPHVRSTLMFLGWLGFSSNG